MESAPAELRFTISVTRAKTGRTETYDMVGHIELPLLTETQPEINNGPLALDPGT